MTIPALIGIVGVIATFSPSEDNFVTDIANAGW
jgi:hypothetical protein